MPSTTTDKRFSFHITERLTICSACHREFILPKDSSLSRKYCDDCRIVELVCARCGTTFKRLRYKVKAHLEEGKPVFCKKNCHPTKEQANQIPDDDRCDDDCYDDDDGILPAAFLDKIFFEDTNRECARIVTPCSPLQDRLTMQNPFEEPPMQVFPLLPLSEPLEKIKQRTNSAEYRRYAAFWA
jgi:hypothetical protein